MAGKTPAGLENDGIGTDYDKKVEMSKIRRKRRAISKLIHIDTVIRVVRNERVILDTDLAQLYGIPTFRLNEAVKRNRDRFPDDFLFRLTKDEHDRLTSQFAMSKGGRGGRRSLSAGVQLPLSFRAFPQRPTQLGGYTNG